MAKNVKPRAIGAGLDNLYQMNTLNSGYDVCTRKLDCGVRILWIPFCLGRELDTGKNPFRCPFFNRPRILGRLSINSRGDQREPGIYGYLRDSDEAGASSESPFLPCKYKKVPPFRVGT